MAVVIHTFPLVWYYTFLMQCGFKGFPNMTGTNKKTTDTTFNCWTQEEGNWRMQTNTILKTAEHSSCSSPSLSHHSAAQPLFTLGQCMAGFHKFVVIIGAGKISLLYIPNSHYFHYTFLRNNYSRITVCQDQEFCTSDAEKWHFKELYTSYNYTLCTWENFGTRRN